jgi:hypothetical protein
MMIVMKQVRIICYRYFWHRCAPTPQFRFNHRFDLRTIFPALLIAVVSTAPHPVRNLVAESGG